MPVCSVDVAVPSIRADKRYVTRDGLLVKLVPLEFGNGKLFMAHEQGSTPFSYCEDGYVFDAKEPHPKDLIKEI